MQPTPVINPTPPITGSFDSVLAKYRAQAYTQTDKGSRFERLMQAYLLTDPKYSNLFKKVWLWNEFPYRDDLGGSDTGIDLVALTNDGDYWAVQCKCYQVSAIIDKPTVDTFLSTSGKKFKDSDKNITGFTHRLWISTTNNWGPNATEAIRNQHPPVTRYNLSELQSAPVDWEKLEQQIHGEAARAPKKMLRPHQLKAMEKAHDHFRKNDRGKMIMACGTGKTFTSLRIAENETKGKGLILFLVPSISLLGQSLNEWFAEANEPINAICICSDPEISRKKTKIEDSDLTSTIDLALPASTNTKEILNQFEHIKKNGRKGMTVVFSTYQSIDVIARAQKELIKHGYNEFDLIICDEAHRTTGVTLTSGDESAFVKVHDEKFIRAKKRLYMTATPRLYNDDSKARAKEADALLCSMDDEELYGNEFYHIGFGEAVDKGLLSDYKVLILTLNEKNIPPAIYKMIADNKDNIDTNDASKLIGSINALSKQILGDEGILKKSDPEPMRRAVAFCRSIDLSKKTKDEYNRVSESYISSLPEIERENLLSITAKHIDGTMTAPERDQLLSWLKQGVNDGECRVLTNVRCLSEGIDVPALDAVMFLSPRNSQVDVVQSVGRVMRKSPGKKYGYIIIPIVVPFDVEPERALDNNDEYKVVWSVLNALRAHDDRFNSTVNKIELNENRPDQILVGGSPYSFDDGDLIVRDHESPAYAKKISSQLALEFEQLQNAVFAKMVQKVGDKRYWEQWAKSVAQIADKHETRIRRLIKDNSKYRKAFDKFLDGLKKNINPNVTEEEAIEMLSQHIITAPVFDALFENYSFAKSNPISLSMQKILDLLEEHSMEKDNKELGKFYESVRRRAEGIDNAEGRQRIIIELYEKYFKTAMPKLVDKLGIVYTPVEVVDFIIHSVNDVLKKEFGRSLSDENVNILDPFTGTGTFISRLIESGLIEKKDLPRKYRNEIFANEIVLLAYYIAAVNIENAYHDAMGEKDYTPFDGICLTDSFQLGETDGNEKMFSEMFPQNSERVEKQKKTNLKVIIGNPPYSVGQKSANDNAQNQKYDTLDSLIASTYAALTNATNKNSLYDSYIKAFRWSTDRLDKSGGIICFVSNGAWLDGNSADGFRKSLQKEFSSVYVFNLRGNARTSGDLRQKEAGNVFGSGSRTPIAITLLVKNPNSKSQRATIHYFDIGDYLNRDEKLVIVNKFASVGNPQMSWKELQPNEHGDWIRMRSSVFEEFITLGDKDGKIKDTYFESNYSNGVKTNRDAWCYNSSLKKVINNIKKTISFYNEQTETFQIAITKKPLLKVEEFIDFDSTKISWDRENKSDVLKNVIYKFDASSIRHGHYRPFFKQHMYFNRKINNCIYQQYKHFPSADSINKVICVSGVGVTKDFSVIITDMLPDLELIGKSQCFPLYIFEEHQNRAKTLFDDGAEANSDLIRRDGITNFILEKAKNKYSKNIVKEDIFYYVYGFLHSPEYRQTFANDLKKMLPRLPLVEDEKDFWSFSRAGRKLAELHINYESVPSYKGVKVTGEESKFFKVEKMRFPKKERKDTIIYNSRITVSDIPAKAYEYVVNGKSAIEWIMERYQVTTHKESGITNDPNDWAEEVGNPRYILDLLLSVINVSVETVAIVEGLPKMRFE